VIIGDVCKLFFYDLSGTKRRSSRKEFNCRFAMMWFVPVSLYRYIEDLTNHISSLSFSDLVIDKLIIGLELFVFFILFILAWCLLLQFFFLIHRRIHDLGFRGWWQLLIFSPISPFFILVLMVIKGEEGKNKYGDPPKF